MSGDQSPWRFLESPRQVDVDGLTEAALKSYSIMRSWDLAQTHLDNHRTTHLKERLVQQANRYRVAISDSVKSAHDGCTLAKDSVTMCEFLSSRRSNSNDDLQIFVTSTAKIAAAAHQHSLNVSRQFVSIRSELFQICRQIPVIVAAIEQDSKQSAESNNGLRAATPSSSPASQFQNGVRADINANSLADTIAQIQSTRDELEDVLVLVSQFTDWWSQTKSSLGSLQAVIPQIKVDGTNPLRTVLVKQRWDGIHEQFFLYASRVALIQDMSDQGPPDPVSSAPQDVRPLFSPTTPSDGQQSPLRDSDSDTVISHCDSLQPGNPASTAEVEGPPPSNNITPLSQANVVPVTEFPRKPSASPTSNTQDIQRDASSSLASIETCLTDSQPTYTTIRPDEDSLKFFQQPSDLSVEALSSSALKAFAIIEPWLAAQQCSGHPLINKMVDAVVVQAKSYRSAIHKSLNTANDGVNLADDAITLCEYLLEARDSSKDISAFVTSMTETAVKAHQRAKATSHQFRSIRSGLSQVGRGIPDIVSTIEKEHQSRVYGIKANVVILPAPLRLSQTTLVDDPEQIQHKVQDRGSLREKQEKTFSDIAIQLDRAREDVGQLITHAGNFVNWWGELIISLHGLQTVIGTAKSSNPLRLKDINKRWLTLREQYVLYSHRMTLIEDTFPTYKKASKKDSFQNTQSFRLSLRRRLKKFMEHKVMARFLRIDSEEHSGTESEVAHDIDQYSAVILT